MVLAMRFFGRKFRDQTPVRAIWKRYIQDCWLFVALLSAVGIVSLAIYHFGDPAFAAIVSLYGTYAVVPAVLAILVLGDSKRRWPNDPWFVRLHKVVTFSRDPGSQ